MTAESSANAIVDQLNLSAEAGALWQPGLDLSVFADALEQRGLHADALRVVAHTLEKRRAVWWGCLCCWEVLRPEAATPGGRAVEAAVHWVLEPSEDQRLAAQTPGEAAGMDSAAGCLAHAVMYSGGSMRAPGLPVIPAPYECANMVGIGSMLATTARGPHQTRPLARLFLSLAREVRGGRHLWSEPT